MHTHQVAIPAWRWTHQKIAAVEPLLKRIAAEKIILLSSGGSDWINGSGTARKVEGGYRVSGRKVFTSGAAAGDILMTGAVLEEGGERFVLHFGAPMKAAEVRIEDTWHTLGMRGTGSHDVVLEELFVPDAGVALKRKAGEWHPLFQIIATTAFPLVYAAYLGIADRACEIALELARKRPMTPELRGLAGRMMTELRGAELAHEAMVAVVERNAPSADSVNDVMTAKTLVADHAIRAVELAMELAGGAGFYRAAGLERQFRDIQGARYHPLQRGPQAQYAGAMALGEPVATVF
jgi:alkylation response protein AidB-like acyl-CoA dehydrogenase